MIWTEEKEAQIKQYKSIINRGRLVSSRAVTDLFNDVFGTNIKPVSCATCIRNRILKIWRAYEEHLKEKAEQEEIKKQEATQAQETHLEEAKVQEVVEDKVEEVKAPTKRKYVRKKKEVE